jgi:tetratricopeptide (TPR) repeat protein
MLVNRFEERRGGHEAAHVMRPKAENQDPVLPSDRNRAMVETGGAEEVSRQPDAERTLLAQANSYLLMGRYEEAILAYRSIIVERPDLAEARYGLGVSYAKGRRYGAAIKELEEAIRLSPEYAEAHHILGLLYLTSGHREAALEEHRVLVGLDKKLAEELFIYISNMQNFVGR